MSDQINRDNLKDLKTFYLEEAKLKFFEEMVKLFQNEGLTVEKTDVDWNQLLFIGGVPVIFDYSENCLSFVDEEYWFKKLNLNSTQQTLLKQLPNHRFSGVKYMSDVIKKFLEENPIYSSNKLNTLNSKTGALEHLTFESWKQSEKLKDINKKSGVFEEEDSELSDDEDYINDCLIDYSTETAMIVADHGELKVGVIYDNNGDPIEDAITIETIGTAPDGYVTINVNELKKLLETAFKNLDNFPKVI